MPVPIQNNSGTKRRWPGNGLKMKKLLIAIAVIELGAGAALMCFPSMMLALLLGPGLDTAAAATLGRLAGVALSALGVAC